MVLVLWCGGNADKKKPSVETEGCQPKPTAYEKFLD
jgi:hypothetical protein